VSPFQNHDDPLWKGDCVEVFIDADGDRKGYVELQVSPAGVTFDSWFAGTRAQPGDVSWDSGMVAAVKLRGSVAAGDSGDQGWDLELGIPWAAVKGRDDGMKVSLPPRVGDRWRLNVVRVDRKTGDDKYVAAASWNRITMADFHALDRMLTVVFADESGSIIPRAKAAVAPSGPIDVTLVAAPAAGAVVVELLDGGGAKLDGVTLKDTELTAALGNRDRDVQLAIRAQPNVWHVRASGVLERARHAGFTSIALVTPVDLQLARNPVEAAQPGPLPHGLVIDPAQPLELHVAADGAVRIVGTQLTDADLDHVLAAVADRDRSQRVVVRPDGTVKLSHVRSALEHARLAGLEQLAIGEPVTRIPPAAEAALDQLLASKGAIVLEVTNAEMRFGGATLSDDQLGALLERAVARRRGLELVISSDASTAHGRIVALLDRARRAGVEHIALGAGKAAPRAVAPEPDTGPKPLVVELALDGRTWVAGRVVEPAALADLLREEGERDPATQVTIRADPGVPYSRVTTLLDRLAAAGLTRISITGR
jgi:biopolymer transport protein ExbD